MQSVKNKKIIKPSNSPAVSPVYTSILYILVVVLIDKLTVLEIVN